MLRRAILVMILPAALVAQAPAAIASRDSTMLVFESVADVYGSRLVAAFDSIPAERYGYRPTPAQQSIGFIAQHLESANYGLCQRLGALKHARTARDEFADTVKARWPKDTLVARLDASLRFCDSAMAQVSGVDSPARASTLLAFETDLAEHYSQIAGYMRLLGMVPPSALPAGRHTAIALPASVLARYVGTYLVSPTLRLDVAMRDSTLFVQSSRGGQAVRLWPESTTRFFVKEVDAQITFTRGAGGETTGLILRQYGRSRAGKKIR